LVVITGTKFSLVLAHDMHLTEIEDGKARMKAHYARLFTDVNSASKFEDMEVDLVKGFSVPPAEPLFNAPFLVPEGATFWIGAPTDWKGDVAHPAPRRMIFITVRGEYAVTVSDNVVRHFPAGSVLVVEDTTGIGHSTKITSKEDCYVFGVGLASAKSGHPAAD